MKPVRVDLSMQKSGHRKRPVVRVLMEDGRTAVFKEPRALVIPETDDGPADQIFAVLVNRAGEPFHTPDGKPAILSVPVMQLGQIYDPDEQLTWKRVAQMAGVSLSSVKRAVDKGALPAPQLVPGMERAVRFTAADVMDWINKQRGR